jgi:hypothetical protein
MRTAVFPFLGGRHMVLVVDERYVLDNFYQQVRPIEEYLALSPQLMPLPPALMAGKGVRNLFPSGVASSGKGS